MEEDLVIYKELFLRRIFGISKLFKKIILMFVQNKLVLKNSSDSHGYGCISVGKFCSAFGEVK